MTKVVRTVCIDAEVWNDAKMKCESISGTINDLLIQWLTTAADIQERSKIQMALAEKEKMRIEMEKMRQELEEIKKVQSKNKIIRVIE